MAKHIVVVGAGMAGLATAVALQRRGLDVTVFEERADMSNGAGISIWPNALAALGAIGLGDAVREAGGRVTAGALRWRDGTWLRRPNHDRMVRALGEPLVVVRRATLTDVLRSGLAPDTVRHGVTVRGLTAGAGGVSLRLSGDSGYHASGVVGADGTRSVVARHLNGPLRQRYAGYTAWRGVAACAIDPDLAGETMGPAVEFGHVPMGGDHTYWFASERAPEGATAAEGELAYLRAKYSAWAEPVRTVLSTTDPAALQRHDSYDRSTARTWARGPVVAVGDAAHAMRPHLGQGGCQALEDAAILAAFVGDGADLPTAFSRFAGFRRPRVAPLIRESALIGRMVNLRPAPLPAAAGRATVLIPEALATRHLAAVASRTAFAMPTDRDVQPA
ncbi:FAD-dependent oxidoreductase [Mycobacterium sp.]|uniref:FAD-dependent oxidoreductase n=1 Tax=Mycobacterium sp. TaxID=1785 RepID=UPI002CC9759F|nr:FAD-dependent oxidoreductase [Mycobacterium sp.]HME50105.1 FAD-dependent oxidoreductase [Mycobacterium sp.]